MNELDISTQITLYGHHLQARFCKSLDLFLRCWQKVPHIIMDKILSKEHFSKKSKWRTATGFLLAGRQQLMPAGKPVSLPLSDANPSLHKIRTCGKLILNKQGFLGCEVLSELVSLPLFTWTGCYRGIHILEFYHHLIAATLVELLFYIQQVWQVLQIQWLES